MKNRAFPPERCSGALPIRAIAGIAVTLTARNPLAATAPQTYRGRSSENSTFHLSDQRDPFILEPSEISATSAMTATEEIRYRLPSTHTVPGCGEAAVTSSTRMTVPQEGMYRRKGRFGSYPLHEKDP